MFLAKVSTFTLPLQRRGFCRDFGSKTVIFQAECQAVPDVLPGVLTKHRSARCYNKGINKKAPDSMTTFTHFCPEHIGMLVFIAAATAAGLLLVRRSSEKAALRAALVLSIAALAGELVQDVLLVREGYNVPEFLPLHLCNLGLFVNILASFTRGRVRAILAEVSLVLILPGSVGALLFPDWTYRPFLSPVSMLCFFTHSLIVFVPLVFLVRDKVHVSFKHFWYSYLFLALVTPPIYFIDRRFGVNYFFLMYPTKDSPLEWIFDITGEKLYPAGLIFLVTVMLLIVYSVCFVIGKFSKKPSPKSGHKK